MIKKIHVYIVIFIATITITSAISAQNSSESKSGGSVVDELSAFYKLSVDNKDKANAVEKESAAAKTSVAKKEVPIKKPKVADKMGTISNASPKVKEIATDMVVTAYKAKSKTRTSTYDSVSIDETLDISVYQEADLSKTVKVGSDGTINLPLVGTIHVEGLSPQEIEKQITEILGRDYLVNPQVTVLVKEHAKVYVQGEVGRPGAYELKDGLTVIGAIALAGGMTDIASPNAVKIIRTRNNKTTVITVPVGSILKGGGQQEDASLEPNDTIVVPESLF